MKKIIMLAALGCLAVSGCSDPYAGYKLGPARGAVGGSIDAMGGLGRWKSVKPITATAVVTIYDDSGKAMINKQHQVIDLKDDEIEASARTADGSWTAEVEGDEESEFESKGSAASYGSRGLLIGSLRTILHRVRGPMNLCVGDERATGSERVRIDGRDMIRVPVTGGSCGVKAYYFDAQTYVLRLVTAGADEAGADGTVTVYSWRMMPNGMAFPEKISVMKIGKHVLVGDEPVLEVNYRKVEW